MKLSFAISMQDTTFKPIGQGDWKELCAYMAEMGFDGVELAIKEPQKVDRTTVKEHLNRYNLKLTAIGTGQAYHDKGLSLIDEDEDLRTQAVNFIKRHIELAADYGAGVIIGLIRGRLERQADKQKAYEFFKENMVRLDEYAQAAGVDLVIEPINRYETDYLNSAEQALSVINDCGLKQTGILLDTFHMNIEEPNWDRSIQMVAGNLKYIHIADSNRCYPGSGHIDFWALGNILKAIGYEGFYSGEMLPVPDLKMAIRHYYNYMRKL